MLDSPIRKNADGFFCFFGYGRAKEKRVRIGGEISLKNLVKLLFLEFGSSYFSQGQSHTHSVSNIESISQAAISPGVIPILYQISISQAAAIAIAVGG